MSAHLEVIQPPAPVRRSPIAPWHEMHGTSFAIREAMSVPVEFGITAPQGNALQLCDVSWRRRFGCKGPHAEAALVACGIVVPPGVNRWCCDERGILVVRLTTREFLIQCEGEVTVPFAAVAELFGSLQRVPGVYPVSRQDLAIEISGPGLEEFLAQVCSVDFAPILHSCSRESGEVLLTSMIGVAVVVIVRAAATGPRITIWSDPSFAHYFWGTLLEVAADLGGGVAACNAQSESGEYR